MIPVAIHSLDSGLMIDNKGLRNPIADTPVACEKIDLVIAPGLGLIGTAIDSGAAAPITTGFLRPGNYML